MRASSTASSPAANAASDRLYTQGPFAAGLPTQGYQGAEASAARYKAGNLNGAIQHGGNPFEGSRKR